jgi:serine/threonine-protein kinase RsbW
MSIEACRMPGTVRLVFPAEPFAVRTALERLFAALPAGLLDDDARGSAEIVITEVLNNIVEHAYAGVAGEIDLTIRPLEDGLHCTVTDRGTPLPDCNLPGDGLPDSGADDLPEGGFGWYLIRTLSQDISYLRIGTANRLTFRLPAHGSAFSV